MKIKKPDFRTYSAQEIIKSIHDASRSVFRCVYCGGELERQYSDACDSCSHYRLIKYNTDKVNVK